LLQTLLNYLMLVTGYWHQTANVWQHSPKVTMSI